MTSTSKNQLELTDDSFWVQTLSENESWLRKILRNRLENADEVDDVFQEVGLAVAKADLRPTDPAKAEAWLYQVAIRQVLQFRRKAGRYRKLIRGQQERVLPNEQSGTDPMALILRTERSESIRKVMEQLSESDREILILKHAEKWTYKQLADRLGVSTNTIEHRLLKAKRQLQRLLIQLDSEDER